MFVSNGAGDVSAPTTAGSSLSIVVSGGRDAVGSMRRSALLVSSAVLLGVVYFLAARLGLGFRFQNSQIGVVWPPNAILLSAVLLTSRRRWWIIFLATGVAHVVVMAQSVPEWRIVWQIVGNAGFTMATVEALRRFAGLPLHFASRRQVLAYTASTFVMPALFALTTPAFVRSVLHFEATYAPGAAFLRTFLSNATAMLLVAPVVLLWARSGVRAVTALPGRRLLEASVGIAILFGVAVIAFGTVPKIARFPSLLLWIFPPLLWSAVRFGPLGANTSVFCVAALSVLGTAHQLGPFVLLGDADQVLSLELFWIVLCPPVMLLAAVIRERDESEEALHDQRNQLAHVTRLATIGELSGALAHELRQPLTSILANAQAAAVLLARDPVNLAEVREMLSDIAHHDQQAANVVASLRTFIKEGTPQFEPLAVDAVVRDALALGRTSLEIWGVDVQTQIAAGLPRVRGDAVQLLQVMLNLVVNGCEAMSDRPVGDRRLRLRVAGRNGAGEVEVVIADNGVGLPSGAEDRVFEPFFTTKDKGLGLGLSIGRSIVTGHGGRLWAENNPEGGATLHIVLPAEGASRGHGSIRRIDRDC
jgi:signal transduction histidine kinase